MSIKQAPGKEQTFRVRRSEGAASDEPNSTEFEEDRPKIREH
jgi:hypothetical protein